MKNRRNSGWRCSDKDEGRAVHATGSWVDSERVGSAPSTTAPSNRRVDIKKTDMKCHDGWGTTYDPVDNINVSARDDVTSHHAWEAGNIICDWSKAPKIKSVEQWDDTGAKEAWDRLVAAGRSPVNVDPDLYVERNIDWNARIPAHLLAFVDHGTSRYRHRKPRPRPGSPVVLGLETLVHTSCGEDHTQPPIIRCELECGSWRM